MLQDGCTITLKQTAPHVRGGPSIEDIFGARQGVKRDLVSVFSDKEARRGGRHPKARAHRIATEVTVALLGKARLDRKASDHKTAHAAGLSVSHSQGSLQHHQYQRIQNTGLNLFCSRTAVSTDTHLVEWLALIQHGQCSPKASLLHTVSSWSGTGKPVHL